MVMLLAAKKTLPKTHHPDKLEDGKPQGAKAAAANAERTAVSSK